MFEDDNYISMPFEGGGGGAEPFSPNNFLGSGDMGSGMAGGFGFGESPSYINEGGQFNPMQMQAQRSPTLVDLSQPQQQAQQPQLAPSAAAPPPSAAAPSNTGTHAALSQVVQAAKAAQTSLPPVQPMDAIAPTAKLPTPQELGLRGSIDPSTPQRGPDMAALAQRAAGNQAAMAGAAPGLRGTLDADTAQPQQPVAQNNAPLAPAQQGQSVADMMPGAQPWQVDQVERQLKGTPRESWGEFVPTLAANAGYYGQGQQQEAAAMPPVQPLDNAPQRGGNAPVAQVQTNSGKTLDLTPQAIINLKKVALTEVDHHLKGDAFTNQTNGVVDTILNRTMSGRWGKTVQDVVDARKQFSAINGGMPFNGRVYSSVSQIPDSVLDTPAGRRISAQVDSWLQARAGGTPSSVGGNLNYANPYWSSRSNQGWISKLDGPTFGTGRAIHVHGTTPDLMRYMPGSYGIGLPTAVAGTPTMASGTGTPAAFNPAAMPPPQDYGAPQHILSNSLGRPMQDSDVDNFFAQLRRR